MNVRRSHLEYGLIEMRIEKSCLRLPICDINQGLQEVRREDGRGSFVGFKLYGYSLWVDMIDSDNRYWLWAVDEIFCCCVAAVCRERHRLWEGSGLI